MNSNLFRQNRAVALKRLAVALRRSQLSCDLDELDSALSDVREPPSGADSWGYSIEEVIFKQPDDPSEVVPEEATLSKIALGVTLEGKCKEDGQEDPLNDLGVNLKLIADGGEGKKLKSFWYMDRSESEEDKIEIPVHPRYHFQFGGIRAKGINTGEVILSSIPRIAHPPLDFCLSVDFVLSNFFKEEWVRLRTEDDQYYGIIREAQRLFWKPYACASKRGWDRVSNQHSWQAIQVWPQLIPGDGINDLHD